MGPYENEYVKWKTRADEITSLFGIENQYRTHFKQLLVDIYGILTSINAITNLENATSKSADICALLFMISEDIMEVCRTMAPDVDKETFESEVLSLISNYSDIFTRYKY
ncbi:MAG: hypothetical protein E3J86_07820 [Candidatus Thorarchaeota archaeon]|nr:MAG: hypothetical protein E3J86_07820 [Candidatus Thorarchaeota archaeon]